MQSEEWSVIFTPKFYSFGCSFFHYEGLSLLMLFLFIWRALLSHSLRVGLIVISSINFSSFENVLIYPLFLKKQFCQVKDSQWTVLTF